MGSLNLYGSLDFDCSYCTVRSIFGIVGSNGPVDPKSSLDLGHCRSLGPRSNTCVICTDFESVLEDLCSYILYVPMKRILCCSDMK